jgi:sterol desaturase/sphingolipid hydroxylase (fatty acid hydroxylase superfamily)
LLHRFAFHFDAKSERGKKFVHDHHLVHHQNPNDTSDLFASLTTTIPAASAFFFACWMILGTWRTAVWALDGLVLGYVSYELLHYCAHHVQPRGRLMRWLKKYHMLHHHQDSRSRYGVSSPLLDLLFGTFRPVGRRGHTLS